MEIISQGRARKYEANTFFQSSRLLCSHWQYQCRSSRTTSGVTRVNVFCDIYLLVPPFMINFIASYSYGGDYSVSHFGTSCSPRLEPVGFLSILLFWTILPFGPGLKMVQK